MEAEDVAQEVGGVVCGVFALVEGVVVGCVG